MKKKFISAMLFGALTVASTTTFVSCKDYDDDITNLQTQIDNLQKAIDDIKSQITAGAILTDVSSITDGVKLTLSNGKSYEITNGKDGADGTNGVDGKDGSVVSIGDNGNWFIDGVDTGLAAKGEKGDTGADGVDGAYYYPESDGHFYKVDADGTKTKTTITWKTTNDKIYAVWSDATLTLCNVPTTEGGEASDPIVISLKSKLKSLVFNPEEYYQGIEALGIYSYSYTAITKGLATPDLSKDQTDDKATEYASSLTTLAPECEATYYLNPSNALMSTDKSNYSFILKNVAYTRAESKKLGLTINSVEVDKGIATVHFDVENPGLISSIPYIGYGYGNVYTYSDEEGNEYTNVYTTNYEYDGKVNVAALQYTYPTASKSDTTITSDFAAIHHYRIEDFYINKANEVLATEQAGGAHDHLATTAYDATHNSGYPQLDIEYNDADGIDLDSLIDVHYGWEQTSSHYWSSDTYWGFQSDINKKNFSLKYELIGYISGDNNTNESAHAIIESDGHTLKVQGYNGAAVTRAIIGRKPLVRVTLIDNNTNAQVAAVGYIVVNITDAYTDPVTAEADPITDKFYLVCADDYALNQKAISWDEIENKVLAKLDLDKATFERLYYFDSSRQYGLTNGKFSVLDTNIGQVTSTYTDWQDHQTNVLVWTISGAEAYKYFVTEKKTTISTWVSFVKYGDDNDKVMVKLTWTPEAINITPAAAILDGDGNDKVKADWHKTSSRDAGYDEVHMQIGAPTSTDVAAFNQLTLDKVFIVTPAERVKKDLIAAGYSTLAANAVTKYAFAPTAEQTKQKYTGNDGADYTVKVNDAGTKIYAVDKDNVEHLLATMVDPYTGVVEVATNDVANAILNKPAYDKDVTDALTLTIKIGTKTCDPAKDLVTVTNNKFNIRVIKPLYIESISVKSMKLNEGTSLTRNVTVNFKDFVEYNPKTFATYNTSSVDFFTFYGITEYAVDEENITTNYTGKVDKVNSDIFTVDYTPGTVTYDSTTGNPIIGTVTLTQVNMSMANSFEIYIPVTVKYACGTLTDTITIKVEASNSGE